MRSNSLALLDKPAVAPQFFVLTVHEQKVTRAMRTIEAVGGAPRVAVISTTVLLVLLRVWGSWPWQQRLLVDQWNEQIQRLPDEDVPAAIDRLSGTGAVAIGVLVDAIGSDRQVVANAACRALIAIVEEAGEVKGDRGHSMDNREETLAAIARVLAGSVSSYGPAGRSHAARIAHRLLIRSFDRNERDGLTLIADCETILDVAARGQEPVQAVGNEIGPDGGRSRSGPFSPERKGRRPATVEAPPAHEFSAQSAEFLAELPWSSEVETSHSISTTAERAAIASQGQTTGNEAAAEPSAQVARLAGTESAVSSHTLALPGRLKVPTDAKRLPRSGQHRSQAVRPASAETGADGEVREGSRPGATLDRGNLASVSTRELIRSLVGSQHEAVRAEAELTNRGFAARQIEVARRLADPDPAVRRRLVEQIVRLAGIDPRRWLLWLSEDEQPDVRLAALTLMATSTDPRLLHRVEQAAARDPDSRIQRLADRLGGGGQRSDR
ncbi:MAG: HEAT repeat domain-containing protein [Pirellulales bacterium]